MQVAKCTKITMPNKNQNKNKNKNKNKKKINYVQESDIIISYMLLI